MLTVGAAVYRRNRKVGPIEIARTVLCWLLLVGVGSGGLASTGLSEVGQVAYAQPLDAFPAVPRKHLLLTKPLVLRSGDVLENYILEAAPDFRGDAIVKTEGLAENIVVRNVLVIGRLAGDDPKRNARDVPYSLNGFQLNMAAGRMDNCIARNLPGWGFVLKRPSGSGPGRSKRGNWLSYLEATECLSGLSLALGDGVCAGDIAAGNIRDTGIEVLSPMVFENLHTWNIGGLGGKFDKLCTVSGQLYIDAWHAKGGWEVNAAGTHLGYVRIAKVGNDGSNPAAAALMLNALSTVDYLQIETVASPLQADGTRERGENVAVLVPGKGSGSRILAARIMYARDGTPVFKIGTDVSINVLTAYTPTPNSDDPAWAIVFTGTNGHDSRIMGEFGNMKAVDMSQVKGLHGNIVKIKSDVLEPVRLPDRMRDNKIEVNGRAMRGKTSGGGQSP